MEMFKDTGGKTSSSRVISISIIITSIVLAIAIVAVGIYLSLKNDSPTALLTSASAAGTLFVTMGGASMFFLYNQKKGEIRAMADVLNATNHGYSPPDPYSYPNTKYNPSDSKYQKDPGEYNGTPIIQ